MRESIRNKCRQLFLSMTLFFSLNQRRIMIKLSKEIVRQIVEHIQMDGNISVDNKLNVLFAPDNPVPGRVSPFRSHGIGQMMGNGTFDFSPRPRQRAQSELIRKLTHGRVSKTKDGAIQLTIKVRCDEGLNISQTIAHEALIATKAVAEWQLKRG